MGRRLTVLLVAAGAASGVSGCGVADPYSTRSGHQSTTAAARRATGPAPIALHADGGAQALLRRYTTLSINWTSHTLASRQLKLAAMAIRGARAQALQTSASYGHGSTLQRSRVADHGQITSIAPGQGPRRGWWLISTQETTTGSGGYQHLPAQPHLYAARLTHTPAGWKVSTWSPQN